MHRQNKTNKTNQTKTKETQITVKRKTTRLKCNNSLFWHAILLIFSSIVKMFTCVEIGLLLQITVEESDNEDDDNDEYDDGAAGTSRDVAKASTTQNQTTHTGM